MWWKTKVWISAAFLMATSALHLTIEHDLLADERQPDSSTPHPTQRTSSSDKLVNSLEVDREEINVVSSEQLKENEQLEDVAKSEENDNVKVEERPPIGDANIGEDTGIDPKGGGAATIGHNDREPSEDTEGDDNEGGDFEGGGNESEGEGGGNVGEDEDNEDGNNVDDADGDNGGNEDDGNGGAEDDDTGGGGIDGGGEDDDNGSNGGDTDDDEGGNNGDDGGNNDENGELPPEDNGGDKENETIVETTSGPVRGHAWRENANIISYIDVRYGTFNNPFQAPVSPTPSTSVHEAKVHSKRCPQLEDDLYVGDSDCLTLSIFKPLDASDASVLVHIYDGNFSGGSADPTIYGPEYLVSKGIILVLPNYRVGPLGFLCLHNQTAQGNAALKDLSLALSWVKANIMKFGGNPDNIAVSGDGTAGALAGYLALSPMSRENVNKVITESGSILSPWAFERNPIAAAVNLVNNIEGFSTWQNLQLSLIVAAAKNIKLRPCLERNNDDGTHFMVEPPSTLLDNEEISIKFMIGSAQYAGVHEFLKHTEDTIQKLNDDTSLLLPNDLRFETDEERNSAANQVKSQYFGDAAISLTNVEGLTLYFTDAAYLGPAIRTARPLVNAGATVYFFEFSFVGDLNRELEAINHPVNGAVRGDIIGYLFTQDGIVPKDDTNEMRMVEQLVDLWTTFLRTGTPSAENVVWNGLQHVSASEEEWLSIGTVLTLQKGLYVDRLNLWTDIYDKHFIEKNIAFDTSPSICTVLILQVLLFISFFTNASHFF